MNAVNIHRGKTGTNVDSVAYSYLEDLCDKIFFCKVHHTEKTGDSGDTPIGSKSRILLFKIGSVTRYVCINSWYLEYVVFLIARWRTCRNTMHRKIKYLNGSTTHNFILESEVWNNNVSTTMTQIGKELLFQQSIHRTNNNAIKHALA